MRIAQLAPLFESVPPKLYGGTERVVSYLTEELIRLGHEVTLFASGDSRTQARLVPLCPQALRLNRAFDNGIRHLLMVEKVFQWASEFDIIHVHFDYQHYPLARRWGTATLTTLHGRLDLPELIELYKEFSEMPVVSISHSQRQPMPHLNWQGTVYHGLPSDLYHFSPQPGKYLAFIGRISPEKGVDAAIDIAIRAEMPLKIAAKVDSADTDYFEAVIRRKLEHPLVEFLGEIGESEKNEFLGQALALLFAIDWPEPFGLAMIEALACGTPVVARRRGSVPEIVEDGVTGFIWETEEEAVQALRRVEGLNRADCRRSYEDHFTSTRMAWDYLNIYARLLAMQEMEVDRVTWAKSSRLPINIIF
ncbi:MAG: glycosyltransferase family 4 protein [Thermodesulfobacteriota bacterium]